MDLSFHPLPIRSIVCAHSWPPPMPLSNPPQPLLLFAPNLQAIGGTGVPHAFTTRIGGHSQGMFSTLNFGNPGDLAENQRDPISTIRLNQAATLTAIGVSTRQIVEVHQVHGSAVHIVRRGEPAHPTPHDTKADALVTDDPSRIIAVRIADCAPILLASSDGTIVAAVHAGWRGVISGILPAAIAAMRQLGASEITAAIGPCIGPDQFQVGPEVVAEFQRVFPAAPHLSRPDPAAPGKFLVDLKSALALQLRDASITSMHILPQCTVSQPELFFSHRREKGRTGRMMALIGPVDSPS
jgi:YfiH family protein